jgi:hypothetical protein
MTIEARAAELADAGCAQARRASDSPLMHGLARAGLCARGCVYVLIAALAAQVASGRQGNTADQKGALQQVADQPFGRVALVLLAAAFAGYAVWRLLTVITGEPGAAHVAGPRRAAARVVAGVQGVVFAALCVRTVTTLVGGGGGSSSAQKPAAPTGRLLGLPAGRPLVAAIGVGVILAGIGLGWWAVSQKFEERLMMGGMSTVTRRAVVGLAIGGHVSRAVVVVLVGVSLVKAAADYDATRALGLDEALRSLAADPYGTVLLLFTAVGLLAFGLFSFLEARYRKL